MPPQPNPLFCGTLHLVDISYRVSTGAGHTQTISMSAADLATIMQYLGHAIVPINGYASQWGACSTALSATSLPFTTPVMTSGTFDDATLQGWVGSIATANGLGASDCVVVPCPTTGGTLSNSFIGNQPDGYHLNTAAGVPYIFFYVRATNLTVGDGANVYAWGLSHEVAEMTVDPYPTVHKNYEVCDPCELAPTYVNFFDANDDWIQSGTQQPANGPNNYAYFLAGVVVPSDAPTDGTQAPAKACQYAPPRNQFDVQPIQFLVNAALSADTIGARGSTWLTGRFGATTDTADSVMHVNPQTGVVTWVTGEPASLQFMQNQFPDEGPAVPTDTALWFAGDIDGDGMTDLVHPVSGADYAEIWKCKGWGDFEVKQFSPGAGYAIPNGVWLMGDLTGDGTSDIVHAVEGTDYVNVWLSNGDSTFTVKPFSPWNGYAIPNGDWLIADVTGDGKADIVHAVAGTSYFNVWLSNGDGRFTVKRFNPGYDYWIPKMEWRVGDFNGDGRADLLQIGMYDDKVTVWLSNGDGTFNGGKVQAWPGYENSGQWMVGNFVGSAPGLNIPAGQTSIVHAVDGKNYANVWVPNADGTLFQVNPFIPNCGYQMASGPFIVGDFNGDGKCDLLHLSWDTGNHHTWISEAIVQAKLGS